MQKCKAHGLWQICTFPSFSYRLRWVFDRWCYVPTKLFESHLYKASVSFFFYLPSHSLLCIFLSSVLRLLPSLILNQFRGKPHSQAALVRCLRSQFVPLNPCQPQQTLFLFHNPTSVLTLLVWAFQDVMCLLLNWTDSFTSLFLYFNCLLLNFLAFNMAAECVTREAPKGWLTCNICYQKMLTMHCTTRGCYKPTLGPL